MLTCIDTNVASRSHPIFNYLPLTQGSSQLKSFIFLSTFIGFQDVGMTHEPNKSGALIPTSSKQHVLDIC